MNDFHVPVMSNEAIQFLNLSDGKTIVDCTLGGGGHALNVKCQMTNVKLMCIDQDEEALRAASIRLSAYQGIRFVHGNFADLNSLIKEPADGFLFDLGVSSHQINEPSRGFSFRTDGPLDMRMGKIGGLTAAEIVNTLPESDLVKIFSEYGEERFSKRISKAICVMRNANKIKTTFQLKEIIERAIPTWRKRESVARIFQALRIEVNRELDNLKKGLAGAVEKLNPRGRIVVISYHSLEDRIVKWFFREKEKSGILKIITKRPVVPQESEITVNPRAKSAKLRCAEKM